MPALLKLVRDARRFVMYFKEAIEACPLQAYVSALMFSPSHSTIKNRFQHAAPDWIAIKAPIADEWSACLQTFESHSSPVTSVVFSHDSSRLASASPDRTVKIWEASSGRCLQTLEGHSDSVRSVAFRHDTSRLASASSDKTVKIWDAGSGRCLQTVRTGKTLSNISFDATGLHLRTEFGSFNIGDLPHLYTTEISPELQEPQYRGAGTSPDGMWITHDSVKIVWLPSEYRASCAAAATNTVGIGVGSGRVWFCSFVAQDSLTSLSLL